ncbi:TetR/AcrR family transcriptional regulator [Dactylosporangium salmoneum]|uniref:TetR/AcrR family transcriptional regulator n=1 Tax=Dactylosporangium salmoneum TaxID=53361 RepID=A0ABP5TL60_9ACTN
MPEDNEKGYRRSAGTERGLARRQELLEKVVEDLAENGLVDFSLRRAARAAGTTHKVLLYHFDGVDDLLVLAVDRLRQRRIDHSLAAAAGSATTLAGRVEAIWPVLTDPRFGHRVLEQSTGLAMYDPGRYAKFGREATEQYLPALLAICPAHWDERRRREVAEMILATLRGLLLDRVTGGDHEGVDAGLRALLRALRHEEERDLATM